MNAVELATERWLGGDEDGALDDLYDYLDDLLLAGELVQVDSDLQGLILLQAPLGILVGALTITMPWGSLLPHRHAIVSHVRDVGVAWCEDAEAILDGLVVEP